jgi:hypothetical protein
MDRACSALGGIAGAVVVALSSIWLVRYYPGWAITYAALGALVVFTLTSYERDCMPSGHGLLCALTLRMSSH